MNILVLGGTRLIGKHLIKYLLTTNHKITIATRGITPDNFGKSVERLTIERTNINSIQEAFEGKYYDIVYDNLAYSSNDVKCLLDILKCKKYIMTSSVSVYENYKKDMKEIEFEPENHELKWCWRKDDEYSEVKRQAECALYQVYNHIHSIAVRFPYVVGEDDYTKRLYFYVEHIIKNIPICVDNLDEQISFITSDEAGKFLAFLLLKEFNDKINASSYGTIKIKEIIEYIEKRTGKKAIYSVNGDNAPYNNTKTHSLNLQKAECLDFKFTVIDSWIYNLLEMLINQV